MPESGGPAVPVGDGGGLGGRARPVAGPPPVPAVLRPAGISALLDGGFELLKIRPRVLLGGAAIVVVPVQLVVALLRGGPYRYDLFTLVAGSDVGSSHPPAEVLVDSVLAGPGLAVVEALCTFVVGVLVARTVSAWYVGDDPGLVGAVRSGLARPHVLLAAFGVALGARLLGAAALCVGSLVVVVLAGVQAPAVGFEGLGPVASFRRSWQLSNRRLGQVMGVVMGMAVVDQLVRVALCAMPWLLAGGLPEVAELGVRWASSTVAMVISSAYIGATATRTYLDLRVRTEGLDLDLEVTDAFSAIV